MGVSTTSVGAGVAVSKVKPKSAGDTLMCSSLEEKPVSSVSVNVRAVVSWVMPEASQVIWFMPALICRFSSRDQTLPFHRPRVSRPSTLA